MKFSAFLLAIVILYPAHLHAQWQQTSGPTARFVVVGDSAHGDSVRVVDSVYIFGSIPWSITTLNGKIFVGADGGLFVSSDTGVSWAKIADSICPGSLKGRQKTA